MPPDDIDCAFFRVARGPAALRAAALAWEEARARAARIRDSADHAEAREYSRRVHGPRAGVEARGDVDGQSRHVGHDARPRRE